MKKKCFSPLESRWSLIVNIAQMTACCFPILLYFARLFDYSTNFILSSVLILTVSGATGYIWAQVVDQSGVLSDAVSPLKSRGLQDARERSFSCLWLVPSRNPMSISDTAWLVAMKNSDNSVRGTLLANASPGFLPAGFMCLFGFYIGFSGEFGISLERLANAFGTVSPIQVFVLILSGVVSTPLLFNGFFLRFISRSAK